MLVEKPLAFSLDDALAMIRAAKETGNILHTGFWQRWQPNVQTARQITQSGELGDVYYAQMLGGQAARHPWWLIHEPLNGGCWPCGRHRLLQPGYIHVPAG